MRSGVKNKKKYLNSKKKALDCTMWRTRFGREYGPSFDGICSEWRSSDGKFNFCKDEYIDIKKNNFKKPSKWDNKSLKIRN